MRIIAALLFSLLLGTAAHAAQCDGLFGANQVCGSTAGGVPGPVTTNNIAGPSTIAAVAHQFLTSYTASTGAFAQAQPAFTDISGTVAASQLPTPTASTLGGIESYAAVSHQWINTISTAGVPSSTQPAFTDISGTAQLAQGGTGGTTQQAALNNIAPTPTRAGDVIYYNGTNWVALAGNNSGTQVLQETNLGVPSWASPGTGTVTSVVCGPTTITTTGTCFTTGQLPGTTTNDNATAGNVGEYVNSWTADGTSTVTISIASPAVITWTAHGFTATSNSCGVINFTTTGALPTGITAGTNYFIIPGSITTNTFQIATSIANCYAGTAVNTSGSQSGTQTGISNASLVNLTAADIAGINLTAGDWDVSAECHFLPSGTNTGAGCSVGQTANTLVSQPTDSNAYASFPAALSNGVVSVINTAPARVSLSSTTILRLVGQCNFTSGNCIGYGKIRARRKR